MDDVPKGVLAVDVGVSSWLAPSTSLSAAVDGCGALMADVLDISAVVHMANKQLRCGDGGIMAFLSIADGSIRSISPESKGSPLQVVRIGRPEAVFLLLGSARC